MLKRLIIFAGVVTLLFGKAPVRAEQLVLSSHQIDVLKQQCKGARVQLERLNASDTLLRINLGQRYENISTRLMGPMNSRIALSGADGVDMTRTAVEFNKRLDTFRIDYKEYENAISDIIKKDCQAEPIEFYKSIQELRLKREMVREDVQALSDLIDKYKVQFEELAARLSKGKS